jgi:hypothetical protein
MRCIRARFGPLVHHKSMVARTSTAADDSNQEPSAQLEKQARHGMNEFKVSEALRDRIVALRECVGVKHF